jgi:hypothetical protein
MSTRAVYTFKDENKRFSVYKHHDGYPEGAAQFIRAGIAKSWAHDENDPYPLDARFEADDMAAAFVAANKEGGGGVYLTTNHLAHGDLNYHYTIYKRAGVICVDAYKRLYTDDDSVKYKKFFSDSLYLFAVYFKEVA